MVKAFEVKIAADSHEELAEGVKLWAGILGVTPTAAWAGILGVTPTAAPAASSDEKATPTARRRAAAKEALAPVDDDPFATTEEEEETEGEDAAEGETEGEDDDPFSAPAPKRRGRPPKAASAEPQLSEADLKKLRKTLEARLARHYKAPGGAAFVKMVIKKHGGKLISDLPLGVFPAIGKEMDEAGVP